MAFVRRTWRTLMSPLYRNAFFLMATTAANSGFGFVFWIIVARFYPPFDVGLAATAITSLVFLGGIANLGFAVGLIRYLPDAGRDGRAMINSSLTLSGLLGLLVALVFLAGLSIWAPRLSFLRNDPVFLATFVVLGAVVAIAPSVDAAVTAGRRAHFVFLRSLVMGIRVPLPIALAAFLGVFGIFGSWSLALFTSTVVAVLLFLPRVEPAYRPIPTVRPAAIRGLFRFSFANYVASVIASMPAGLLPLLILNLLPLQAAPEAAAHYYVTFSVAALLFVIPGALSTSLYAEGSQPVADFPRDVRRTAKMIALLLTPAIAVLYFLGDWILSLFGAAYSAAGFDLLRLLALSAVPVAILSLYVTKLRVERRIWPIVILAAITSALVLGVSYVLLPGMGIVGIGFAFLLANGLLAGGVGVLWATRPSPRSPVDGSQ